LTVKEFQSELEATGFRLDGPARAQSFGVAHLVGARADVARD